ncbi:MAG: RdgB/HAM1 family non-canonical purine NTP pyrophosphatase [Gammaproteobacteria bacterium]|nr:RdgB/HAM1 family non-canonical purine NTP pyrophosphatase [Gammaproteobacteria bacterium]MDE2345350.1 RdgB/HAM1 family non-canonical purine NTP pyrophosphatase [Gammaproteobacteria bacterium]
MKKVVLATGNPGKLHELRALLMDTGIDVSPQDAYGVKPIEESASSFRDNALLKARHAARVSGLPAIADDSGLEVDALNGAPGVYSARYAGEGASDAANLKKLLYELRQVPAAKRTARFRCIVAFVRDAGDSAPVICEASWDGRILEEPRGRNGFGYDPVFLVPEINMSSAELSPSDKNQLSHRGQALRKLLQELTLLEGRQWQKYAP